MIHVTGRDADEKLHAIVVALNLSRVKTSSLANDMTAQGIYDAILESDGVLVVWGGHESERQELSVELGLALAFGKTVYAVIDSQYLFVPRRFLSLPGVRIFKRADDAIEAIVADLGEADDEQLEDEFNGGTGSGELGGP